MEPHALRARRVPGELPVIAVTDEGLGNSSWVVAMDGDGVVVDPERDPRPYEAAAEQLGVPVVLAAETHLHADFVTGSRELAARGARVAAAAAGGITWPHRAVADGEELDFGRWRLQAVATPGHTPEHVSYVLRDGGRPRAVFTGGSLLVGAVARTDLIDPDDTQALTRALYRSINHRLLALPDDVLVLPTHGAGSFCSSAGGAQRWTTIGEQRTFNPLLAIDDEDDFVRHVIAGFGSYPPYFGRMRELNRIGPVIYGTLPALAPLTADQVHELGNHGAVVVDVRSVEDYAAGHLPRSLANTLRPQFASWLGWLVDDPETPLVFVTDDHTDRAELVRQCLNVGYERLAGEISIDAWQAAGGDVVSTRLVGAGELTGRGVLDVRQGTEFASGHVPGATHVELGALPTRAGELDDGPLVVMCGHGERAATATSLLEAAGRDEVAIVRGGPADWVDATGEDLRVRP
jgi:hydroxyacylglutathione hydrolase